MGKSHSDKFGPVEHAPANRFVSKVEMRSHRLNVFSQPCCIVPIIVPSCLHGRPCATQKPCLGVSESLLQELVNDAPNFFQALSRQILAFGKNPKVGSPCHETALKMLIFL